MLFNNPVPQPLKNLDGVSVTLLIVWFALFGIFTVTTVTTGTAIPSLEPHLVSP